MAVLTPNSINTTLLQDGQAVGSITPSRMRTVALSLASRGATTQSAAYTLVLADAGSRVAINRSAGSTVTVTVPPSVFDVDTEIEIFQQGTDLVYVAPGSGVTINCLAGFIPNTAGRYAVINLHQTATNVWAVSGQLYAAPAQLAAPNTFTAADAVFTDQFLSPTLDSTKWIPWLDNGFGRWDNGVLPAPLSATAPGSYHAEYWDPTQVFTGLPGLRIDSTRDSSQAGFTWKCGLICTHGKATFAGGYFQFRVKQSDTSKGQWPALWHLEGTGGVGGEIDTQDGGFYLAGYSTNQVITFGMGGGPDIASVNCGIDLSADYHIIGMEWVPGKWVRSFVDGIQQGILYNNVPTGAITIIINSQVAGAPAASFHPAYDATTPTSSMYVSDVRVYHTNTINRIRNAMVRAAVVGTPGTLPTNWSVFHNGNTMTTQVVGFGYLPGTNMPYIDWRLAGTPGTSTSTNLTIDGVITATASTTYIASCYAALVGGTTNNIATIGLYCGAYTSGGAFISVYINGGTGIQPIGNLLRFTASGTTPATTGRSDFVVAIGVTSGLAVDITLRLAGLQLETGSAATNWTA